MLTADNIREVAGRVQWSDWGIDESNVATYINKIVSDYGLTTYGDEVACAFQSIGCTVTAIYDWTDGSPIYTVSLPITADEYQDNLKEAREWADG